MVEMLQENGLKLSFGTKVTSKKTGFPGIGFICGFVMPQMTSSYHMHTNWDNLYPEWKAKPIIYVKYEEPRKPLTLEELKISIRLSQQEMTDYEIQEYYNSIPLTNVTSYPIDDLEIVEEG